MDHTQLVDRNNDPSAPESASAHQTSPATESNHRTTKDLMNPINN